MKIALHEYVLPVQLLIPASQSAGTVNTSNLNCQGFDELLLMIDLGTAGASATLTGIVQDAADNGSGAPGSFANIDLNADSVADYQFGTAGHTDSSGIYVQPNQTITQAGGNVSGIFYGRVDLAKVRQWIRVQFTVGTAAYTFGVVAILSNYKYRGGGPTTAYSQTGAPQLVMPGSVLTQTLIAGLNQPAFIGQIGA